MKMSGIRIEKLIFSDFIEPTFNVNCHEFKRPTKNGDLKNNIQKSKDTIYWKIKNEKLTKINKEQIGILFDGESYIVQCFFNLEIENKLLKETLVYYWKGQHAIKGYTPLPPEFEEQCPVERIVQWSEPALFFHACQQKIVFSGKDNEFDINDSHLLLARGELLDEIHFYEVPCKRISLRSRASFLLIVPKKRCFVYWYGSQTCHESREKIVALCQPHNYLKEWQISWSNFSVDEHEENQESALFLDVVKCDTLTQNFIHVKLKTDFTPRLFYLNTITGTFLATEVEYPLRAQNEVAAFPFLQSHLYTAMQPALFLLDNNTELWLWEGIKTVNSDIKVFEEQLQLAIQLQQQYAKEKEKITTKFVICFRTFAHREPQEFRNLFPFWDERFNCY